VWTATAPNPRRLGCPNLNHPLLNPAEVLNTGRFGDKYRRIPRDRDWDLLVTTAVAGIEGDGNSAAAAAAAILWSAAASAVSNL